MIKGKTKIITIGTFSNYFTIPAKLFHDSAFRFKKNKEYDIEICGDKIVVSIGQLR